MTLHIERVIEEYKLTLLAMSLQHLKSLDLDFWTASQRGLGGPMAIHLMVGQGDEGEGDGEQGGGISMLKC